MAICQKRNHLKLQSAIDSITYEFPVGTHVVNQHNKSLKWQKKIFSDTLHNTSILYEDIISLLLIASAIVVICHK